MKKTVTMLGLTLAVSSVSQVSAESINCQRFKFEAQHACQEDSQSPMCLEAQGNAKAACFIRDKIMSSVPKSVNCQRLKFDAQHACQEDAQSPMCLNAQENAKVACSISSPKTQVPAQDNFLEGQPMMGNTEAGSAPSQGTE